MAGNWLDVAYLLAALDRLRAENAALREAGERMGYGETGWPVVLQRGNEILRLQAENERLREAGEALAAWLAYVDADHAARYGLVNPAKHVARWREASSGAGTSSSEAGLNPAPESVKRCVP